MTIWLQHLLVLAITLACATFVVWQSVRTLRGKRSRVGSCCAKGCDQTAKPQAANQQRIVFFPVEMLKK